MATSSRLVLILSHGHAMSINCHPLYSMAICKRATKIFVFCTRTRLWSAFKPSHNYVACNSRTRHHFYFAQEAQTLTTELGRFALELYSHISLRISFFEYIKFCRHFTERLTPTVVFRLTADCFGKIGSREFLLALSKWALLPQV